MDLIKEISGEFPGGIYLKNEQVASLIWSPYWKSEVSEEKKFTHFGRVGKAFIIWPVIPSTIYIFHDIQIIKENIDVNISIEELEKLLIDNNIDFYSKSLPVPNSVKYELIKARV